VHVLAFIGVAGLLVVTPGVDMALVTKNALAHGRRAAVATALGINLGVAVWTIAAALGLAAAVRASATLFDLVRLVGAGYLVYLGLQMWRRSGADSDEIDAPGRLPVTPAAAFRQGAISNLLNPKIAIFFTSLLPQFLSPDASPLQGFLVLGGIFNAMGLAWLTTFAVVAARGRTLLRRPRVKTAVDRLTGAVLVALGARLALERR
jgi:RhtB (resistance to homoserine/threonine) family protein